MVGLDKKRVVVTGGASGIGAATAARFLEEGAAVVVLDRDREAGERLADQLPGLAKVVVVRRLGYGSGSVGHPGGYRRHGGDRRADQQCGHQHPP